MTTRTDLERVAPLRTACPLCGHDSHVALLDRAAVPVFQNVVHANAASAKASATGRLAIRICRWCGFGMNAAFAPELVRYGPHYVNDQSNSRAFARYLADRAAAVVVQLPPRAATVVDVGCGQGEFLRLLVASAGGRVTRGYGFDPAARNPMTVPPAIVRQTIFDAAARADVGHADAIVSRHVIEHVGDPVEFLRSLRDAADPHGTHVFVETPCLEWILARQVVHDLYYEHCCYFTGATLRFALELAGFVVTRLDRVFHGQYLWAEARAAPPDCAPAPSHPLAEALVAAATRFSARYDDAIARVRAIIERAQKVALWGAGAKGATLAAILDPDASSIDCLIDINPDKQGRFIAGSAHAIVAPEQAAARGVRAVVIMNANYRDEIEADIRTRHLPFRTLDIEAAA